MPLASVNARDHRLFTVSSEIAYKYPIKFFDLIINSKEKTVPTLPGSDSYKTRPEERIRSIHQQSYVSHFPHEVSTSEAETDRFTMSQIRHQAYSVFFV
jgi:hypothetical protein